MKVHAPRRGSMQYWPRKRSRKEVPVVKSWPTSENNKNVSQVNLLGFAGYKVGMTHILCQDNYKNSVNKGQSVVLPATILEVPPMLIYSVKFHTKATFGTKVKYEIVNKEINKILSKTVDLPKNKLKYDLNSISIENDIIDISVILASQPQLMGTERKKPQLTEIKLSGSLEDKLKFAKEHINKPVNVTDVFKDGILIDVCSVTKGKGFQGPVKRMGVQIRFHKSEKTKRGPGSLGAWNAAGHLSYRTAHAGQMGYHVRTEKNKELIAISNDITKINPSSGFKHYGLIKNNYILVKGSIPGPKKRMIVLRHAISPNPKLVENRYKLLEIDKN